MKTFLLCAATALLMGPAAQAVMVSYSVEGAGPIYLGDKSAVNANSGIGYLDPANPGAWHGPDAVVFNPVGVTTIANLGTTHASGTMNLNSINWWMNGEVPTTAQNAADYTETISRGITLYLGSGSSAQAQAPQGITQTLTLKVTKKSTGSETQTLTISGGQLTEFSWIDSQGKHDLTLTVTDPITLTGCIGIKANSASLNTGCVTATWDYEVTPIPEAATIWAGALLLAPFGLSAFRSLRRNRE